MLLASSAERFGSSFVGARSLAWFDALDGDGCELSSSLFVANGIPEWDLAVLPLLVWPIVCHASTFGFVDGGVNGTEALLVVSGIEGRLMERIDDCLLVNFCLWSILNYWIPAYAGMTEF